MQHNPLIKSFTEKSHAENFMRGNIILKMVEYYQALGFQGQESHAKNGDINEGTIRCNDGSASVGGYNFILSMHNDGIVKSSYGSHLVKIIYPNQLLEEIERKLKPDYPYGKIEGRKVKYLDPEQANIKNQKFDDTLFTKHIKFCEDAEYRFALEIPLQYDELKNTDNIKFEFYKFCYGRSPRSEKLASFYEWKKSKYESDWEYDHYIEMKLSNIKFGSELPHNP